MTVTTLVTIARRVPQGVIATSASASLSASTTASATSSAPSATTTHSGGGGGDQTPFLYFIALGLGIVFTNLWVILGLKYCFRNRRRNALIARGIIPPDMESLNGPADELGFYMNPLLAPEINRRRRRERRLMKFEELNERFPVMKYKVWGAEREKLGLSAEGGISAAAIGGASRPASIHDVASSSADPNADVVDSNAKDQIEVRESTEGGSTTNQDAFDEPKVSVEGMNSTFDGQVLPLSAHDVARGDDADSQPVQDHTVKEDPSADGDVAVEAGPSYEHEHEHDDEHIMESDGEEDGEYKATLVPPEIADSVGDVCAVCLDSIEPDHDIRALGCHHVFHDECITPWLTTRRASCPLCKMDFSTARYRLENAAAAAAAAEAGIAMPEDAHVADRNYELDSNGNPVADSHPPAQSASRRRLFGWVPSGIRPLSSRNRSDQTQSERDGEQQPQQQPPQPQHVEAQDSQIPPTQLAVLTLPATMPIRQNFVRLPYS